MLDFNELLEIARKERDGIDSFEEYKDAILFFGSNDEEAEGGEHQTICVLKTTGRPMYIYELVQNHLANKIADENFVKEGQC